MYEPRAKCLRANLVRLPVALHDNIGVAIACGRVKQGCVTRQRDQDICLFFALIIGVVVIAVAIAARRRYKLVEDRNADA
jgi:hypothetical protein